MSKLAKLKRQLVDLEERIAEAQRRLPAHSTKPATMMMLLELEDERDSLLAQIKALEESSNP
jgi:hypothetical protein